MGSYGKVPQCARGQTAKKRRFPNVQTAKNRSFFIVDQYRGKKNSAEKKKKKVITGSVSELALTLNKKYF